MCSDSFQKLSLIRPHVLCHFFCFFFQPRRLSVQRSDFSPCATTWETQQNELSSCLSCFYGCGNGCSQGTWNNESVSKISQINILGDNKKCVPRNCRNFAPPVSRRLMVWWQRSSESWSEPPSRSNLPKDPPSKTAALHKKDDTDTRIIFKSCGTACSLQQFQRARSKLPFSLFVCAQPQTSTFGTTGRIYFYYFKKNFLWESPKCCVIRLTGAPKPELWLQLILTVCICDVTSGQV